MYRLPVKRHGWEPGQTRVLVQLQNTQTIKTPVRFITAARVWSRKLQVPLPTQSGQAKGCAQGVAVGDGAEEIDPNEGAAKGAHPLVRLALGHGTAYL